MDSNYVLSSVKLKENWFSLNDNNVFRKMGYKGFFIFISMFKFKIGSDKDKHKFIFSISLLRKETGYNSDVVFECLKIFKTLGVIKYDNISRWDNLIDSDNKIKDKDIIVCYANDSPLTHVEIRESKKIDIPDSDNDMYVSVNLEMLNHYLECGLSERYFGLYCLLKFQGDRNVPEKKSLVSVETIANTLGYDKDTVNKMIRELNRNGLLYSNKRKNGKDGFKYEHYLCGNVKEMSIFKKSWLSEGIDKNIKRWDRERKIENGK